MKRPAKIKDESALEYIEHLESKLKKYESSPYVDSYVSLFTQINNWNQQLKDNSIDLFADKEDKSFDRAHKYFTEQTPYFEQLAYLRKQMIPAEKKEADVAIVRIKRERTAIAEKIAINGRD